MELNRVIITESMDDAGEISLEVYLSDGMEPIRAFGMIETAKLEIYHGLPLK